MDMLVKNHKKYYRTTLAFVLCSQVLLVVPLQAGKTRAGRDNVVLSPRDARLVERALNYLVRAPRPDVPNASDPSFPPVTGNLGLEEIRRVLCTIREQNKKICGKIEDLQEELSIHDMLMELDHENICSKLEILQENDEDICSKLEIIEEDLEEHNEVVCSKLEAISEEIENATFICDTTTIQELIGDPCEADAHRFGSCVDQECLNISAGSVLTWLKTILWELRGTFPINTCLECTPIPGCEGP